MSVIIIVLLATTPLHEMHAAPYVFGSQGVINNTNGWPDGLAFLLGLLSVQWTMTVSGIFADEWECTLMHSHQGYDGTAHISEEVRRAAYAAPAAIFIAVIGTGLLGWLLNITVVVCSGDLYVVIECRNVVSLKMVAAQTCLDLRARLFYKS